MKQNKFSDQAAVIIFYDSHCPVCSKSMRFLSKLDRGRKLRYESIRDNQVLERYAIDKTEAEKRMHTFTLKDNQMEKGIFSVQRIVKQLPLFWIAVPILQLSIWAGLGSPLYDWLASRRTILPVGGCEGDRCTISNGEKQVK